MRDFEVQALLNQNYQNYKNTWEQTRFNAYVQASVFNSKIKKPTDVLTFAWDKEELQTQVQTPEELQKIRDSMFAGILK